MKRIKSGVDNVPSFAAWLCFIDTLGRSWEYPIYKVQSLRSDPVSPGFVQVIIRNDNQENLFVCTSECVDRERKKLHSSWDAIAREYLTSQVGKT